MTIRAHVLALLAGLALGTAGAVAEEPAILEVAGAGQMATQLDIEAVKQLGAVNFETTTPWTEGRVTFDAVPGDKLLAVIGGDGKTVQATALDGYSVDIPIEDFKTGKAHIAYQMNGAPLPADQFGPFWIVYQYDSDPALADEAHQARSIWRLKSLTVE
ncbi:MAG: molybdopterin-dependent oxidoreductase [Dongiaceae bacterium]